MARVQLEKIAKRFDGHEAVRSVDLEIKDGEFFTLLGPSGCGKTTLLRIIAGLERASQGRILFDDDDVTERLPKDRDVALVFQDYALYPHLTVRENLAFPLRARRIRLDDRERRIADVARRLQLDGLLERRPRQLSGGQQQRVALGRSIVRSPRIFLMDEPLSNLDAKLRVDMRAELKRLQRTMGATTIYVTHDQEEALTMSDRIAVMRDGMIQQCAVPERIYHAPANLWVGSFVGSPAMNVFDARAKRSGEAIEIFAATDPAARFRATVPVADGPVTVGVRPEAVSLRAESGPGTVPGRVDLIELVGDHYIVLVDTGFGRLTAKVFGDSVPPAGESVHVGLLEAKVHFFAPGSGERLNPSN